MAANPLEPRLTRYVPHSPHPPQQAFLLLSDLGVREVLYGGAAGGGKSDALLMAALQYVDVPGYAALLLRRTFPDLNQADALIPRSKEWLASTDARWNENEHRWYFPSSATLTFGHLQHEDDKLHYQGAAFQMVGFDELTQFTETQYTYLFSRLRRLADSDVPIRMRAASNPGGPGHEWVKQRFGLYRPEGQTTGLFVCQMPDWTERTFIPARLADNPSLDQGEYVGSLNELDTTTRKQLLDGDWDVREPGSLFRREWFEVIDHAPEGCRWVRHWDLAATEPSQANPDPDWTAGLRLGKHPSGLWIVQHVARARSRPDGVEKLIRHHATADGRPVTVSIEQEPGSSGKAIIQHYQRTVLHDFEVRGLRSTGSKEERARPVSAKAEAGLVKLVRGPWIPAFLEELEVFSPDSGTHDDQVDALSGAFIQLAASQGLTAETYMPGTQPTVIRKGDLTLVGDHHIDKE
ncbi:MAG: phage terminase large subunit [Solirubrobacteraceae bacterium]